MKRKTKRGECECCRFKTTLTEFERANVRHRGEKRWLCVLCANTMAGVSTDYYYEDSRVLETICYVGNAILSELRAKRAKGKP